MRLERLWIIQHIALLTMTLWAAGDPLFETMMHSPLSIGPETGWCRAAGLVVVLGAAGGSLIALLGRFVVGPHSDSEARSVRQLLAITTVVALWFSLVLHHDSLAWQGKRARFSFRVDELELIAAPLRQEWPLTDGELPHVGPFMAYPFGRPSTLILLQSPRLATQSTYISSIERCEDGSIKFQLTGIDGGAWAEWHPTDSRPTSFVGGLADLHQLRSVSSIGRGWYLVRYKA